MLHDRLRSEEAYLYGCKVFLRFHGLRHPAALHGPEIETFQAQLATDGPMFLRAIGSGSRHGCC
jgi:hypothetical protein